MLLLAKTLALLAAVDATSLPPTQGIIHAPAPDGPLSGTILTPASAGGPVVLIVPGSGPVDRDGNGPGMPASTYRLLAEGLAERGISTIRIDKRGMYGSRAALADANAVTIGDYAADVRAWVSAIRQRTGAPCVWVLGHSEGGLVALAAAQGAADVCGLILAATAGRPLGAVLREQLQSSPANAPLLGEALSAIAQLENGRRVDVAGLHPALLPLFRPEVQGFLLSEMSLDPATLIAACREPILIVQGQRDIQVSIADAERLAQANAAARLVTLLDTNHVLKTVTSDDRRENLAAYLDPGAPLAPGVVAAVADFIEAVR